MGSAMEMNYCRRCSQPLTNVENHVYKCSNGHILFANASPGAEALLINQNREILMIIRGQDPGKGSLDIPGGFCDGAETFEQALARELQEEIGLAPADYDKLEFLLTHIDMYTYKTEQIPVLVGFFAGRIKSNAAPRPADDVAEVHFMKYEDIEFDKIHFPSVVAGLKFLHKRGDI